MLHRINYNNDISYFSSLSIIGKELSSWNQERNQLHLMELKKRASKYNTTKNKYNEDCKICMFYKSCHKTDEEQCEYLTPVDEDGYCEELMNRLRSKNKPFGRNEAERVPRNQYLHYDSVPSLHGYYKSYIKDCLSEIRSGRTAYLYKEKQIACLLRFEPDINVTYQDGVFYITL